MKEKLIMKETGKDGKKDGDKAPPTRWRSTSYKITTTFETRLLCINRPIDMK